MVQLFLVGFCCWDKVSAVTEQWHCQQQQWNFKMTTAAFLCICMGVSTTQCHQKAHLPAACLPLAKYLSRSQWSNHREGQKYWKEQCYCVISVTVAVQRGLWIALHGCIPESIRTHRGMYMTKLQQGFKPKSSSTGQGIFSCWCKTSSIIKENSLILI